MYHEEEIEIINDFHEAVIVKDIAKYTELFEVLPFDIEDYFSREEQLVG